MPWPGGDPGDGPTDKSLKNLQKLTAVRVGSSTLIDLWWLTSQVIVLWSVYLVLHEVFHTLPMH